MKNVTNKQAVPLQKFVATKSRLPKDSSSGLIAYVRQKFFNNLFNSVLSLAVFYLLYILISGALNWAVFDAVWNAANRRECQTLSPNGACWAGVISWFNNLMYGRYESALQWRVNLGAVFGLLWLIPLALNKTPYKTWVFISAILLYPFLAAYLFLGGEIGSEISLFHAFVSAFALAYLLLLYINLGLAYSRLGTLHRPLIGLCQKITRTKAKPLSFTLVWCFLALIIWMVFASYTLSYVPIDRWGGLFLTFIIAGFAITMAIPLGVILALGRRSKLPVIYWLSLLCIELVRSVPLITVLFMSVTLLPLFLPADIEFNKLSQVLVAVCIFAGAYMAENIRGGLQAIPEGQYEAAKTLGLGYWHSMVLIILPQALRMMIPNIMTSFISLLKDTTLVSIIGLFDIMLMARNIANDKAWLGLHTEPLVLISILFFVLCFGMSQYSLNLEKRLKVGH